MDICFCLEQMDEYIINENPQRIGDHESCYGSECLKSATIMVNESWRRSQAAVPSLGDSHYFDVRDCTLSI